MRWLRKINRVLKRWSSAVLAFLIVFSFLIGALLSSSRDAVWNLSELDIQRYTESLAESLESSGIPFTSDYLENLVEQAHSQAVEIFSTNREKCHRFVEEALNVYSEAINKDFIIIYNSGGWGYTPREEEPW